MQFKVLFTLVCALLPSQLPVIPRDNWISAVCPSLKLAPPKGEGSCPHLPNLVFLLPRLPMKFMPLTLFKTVLFPSLASRLTSS